MNKFNWKALIQVILYDDEWSKKVSAGHELALNITPKIYHFLLDLLADSNGDVLNVVALTLRKIKDDSAVVPILNAIKKKSNKNNQSTLVYALENLDCSHHFHEIFKLALSEKIDVQVAAIHILDKQHFYIDTNDILKAQALLMKSKVKKIENKHKFLLALLKDLYYE